MGRMAGIWIDHRKAVLVIRDGDNTRISTILSAAGPKLRLSGGARSKTPYGPQDIASEGNRDRRIRGELHHFYLEVARQLKEVDSLLVIGPGEAKQEFAREFSASPAHREVPLELEAADKMKDAQILAHITGSWHRRHLH